MEWWLSGLWLVCGAVTLISALIGVQTWEHRRAARARTRFPIHNPPKGRVALFVPCKGADADFEDNLRRLFEQDHANYELTFIVESVDDAACPTIRRLISRYPTLQARLVIAGEATDCGQKVHNLLVGTERLGADVKILAFVDADVRPPRDWLRMLVQRLNHHGAATGYRRVLPKRQTLANWLLASMDSAVVAIMIPGRHHLVWGGSWAIRRDVFESSGLRDSWRGTLSDDLVASRVLAKIRKRVAFEPACIIPSPVDFTMAAMCSFMRRQFTIGRIYTPAAWTTSIVWNCLSQATFWGALVATAVGLWAGAEWTWQPASLLGALYSLHVCRAWLRQDASRFYLPDFQAELAPARRFDIWLGPLAALVCCLGLVSSMFGRRIVWKAIAYQVLPDGQVAHIDRGPRPIKHPALAGAADVESSPQKVAA